MYTIHCIYIYCSFSRGRRGRERIVVEFTTTCAISAYHYAKLSSIQHHVIKFVIDLQQSRWVSPVSSTNETDRHNTTEILLKVALNFINLATPFFLLRQMDGIHARRTFLNCVVYIAPTYLQNRGNIKSSPINLELLLCCLTPLSTIF